MVRVSGYRYRGPGTVRDKQRFGAVDERAELERGIVVSDIVVWCLVSTESGR